MLAVSVSLEAHMPFITELTVTERSDGMWELSNDLVYQGKIDTFTIPKGFLTDFASVPRLFTWLVPRSGQYTKCAVLHDWLLETQAVSRCDADGLFRRTMREIGVAVLRRRVMWAAVRVAGGFASCGPVQLLAIIGIALVILPVAIPGTLLVLAALVVLFVVELAVWGVMKAFGSVAQRPKAFWWT
jgi:hypothetical protein